jgi:hypothetical protein
MSLRYKDAALSSRGGCLSPLQAMLFLPRGNPLCEVLSVGSVLALKKPFEKFFLPCDRSFAMVGMSHIHRRDIGPLNRRESLG